MRALPPLSLRKNQLDGGRGIEPDALARALERRQPPLERLRAR